MVLSGNCGTGPACRGVSWASNRPVGAMAVPVLPDVCDRSHSPHQPEKVPSLGRQTK